MKTALCVALALGSALAQTIVSKRDEPLQTTWFSPKKAPSVRTHEGFLQNFNWRFYPVLSQSFKGDEKAVALKIEVDGPGNWSTGAVALFTVDGEITSIPIDYYGGVNAFTTLGNNRLVVVTLPNQDALAVKVATAKEVWVTLPDANTGDRRSIKLSEPQLQIFREMMERYRSL